jgi:hypothetical protein
VSRFVPINLGANMGTTPRDLVEVREVLPEAYWGLEAIQCDDGEVWIAATDQTGGPWMIGRDDGGCYYAMPECGERSVGIRDLASAQDAALGMRDFVRLGLGRTAGALV